MSETARPAGVVVTVGVFGVPSAAGLRLPNRMVAFALETTSVPPVEPMMAGSSITAETA